jgi:hypothetical protein
MLHISRSVHFSKHAKSQQSIGQKVNADVNIVEEKIKNDLTQTFSDPAWLNQDRREYHPMFIAIKIDILIHKYCLQVLRLVFFINKILLKNSLFM